jgi:hypothetical protein
MAVPPVRLPITGVGKTEKASTFLLREKTVSGYTGWGHQTLAHRRHERSRWGNFGVAISIREARGTM